MDADGLEQLLRDWRAGDTTALDRMVPIIYAELRRLARGQLRRDPAARSVQPTVLVHEAYLQLLGARVDWQDRTHFLSIAARVMRRVLVQRARARKARMRGGDDVRARSLPPLPRPTKTWWASSISTAPSSASTRSTSARRGWSSCATSVDSPIRRSVS